MHTISCFISYVYDDIEASLVSNADPVKTECQQK